MVIEYETIMHKNVVWHTYEIHYSQLNQALEDFNEKLVGAGLTVKGPLFYALYNIPLDERILIDIYMPVEQSYVSADKTDLMFQSYFYMDDMLMTRVINNFEMKTEHALAGLLQYAVLEGYEIISPIFHIFRGDESSNWVELKAKVYRGEKSNSTLDDSELDLEASLAELFKK